ncbi:MAG: insulinase family protein [Candidatus Hydrogenedentota bacterium]|nr:MAG: insulinase family protein [Candidatus Hydrogenedentota bacterium]
MKKISILIFLSVGTLFSQNSIADSIRQNFEQNVKKYVLPNGLRVILMKNKITPSIACYLKIGVGAANEPFDLAGTAHMLEHMLFKGTKELGTRNYDREKIYLEQIAVDGERVDTINRILSDPLLDKQTKKKLLEKKKRIEKRLAFLQKIASRFVLSEEDSTAYSLAGQTGYNAYTSADVTNYQIQLPANRLELWSWLESQKFLNPVFREYYAERKVVREERRMRYESRPARMMYEVYLKTSFGFHPYGKPVIGFASNIEKLKLSETKKFFEENYIPSRMVIAIVGDIEFDSAIATVQKYFGKLPAKKPVEFPPIQDDISSYRREAVYFAKDRPYMITGWRKPSIQDKNNVAFEVLSRALTDGQNSRLVKRLVIEEKLATSVSSYNGNPGEKLNNDFTIFVRPFREQDYAKIEKIIYEELEKIQKEGLSKEELTRIKNNYLAEMVSSLQSNAGLADALTYYELLLGDYREFYRFIDRLDNINAKIISDIVRKYLRYDRATLVVLKQPK